jgi:hypothetical protein
MNADAGISATRNTRCTFQDLTFGNDFNRGGISGHYALWMGYGSDNVVQRWAAHAAAAPRLRHRSPPPPRRARTHDTPSLIAPLRSEAAALAAACRVNVGTRMMHDITLTAYEQQTVVRACKGTDLNIGKWRQERGGLHPCT